MQNAGAAFGQQGIAGAVLAVAVHARALSLKVNWCTAVENVMLRFYHLQKWRETKNPQFKGMLSIVQCRTCAQCAMKR